MSEWTVWPWRSSSVAGLIEALARFNAPSACQRIADVQAEAKLVHLSTPSSGF